MSAKDQLKTDSPITWCPGCPNFMILEAVKQTIADYIDSKKYRQEDIVLTADIGCNSKIFDYLNLSGIYGLHGRALPTGIGIKLGNPNLKVLTFAGDGGLYSEGISHLMHAFRYNPDMTLVVHDNQSFSLTTGQPAPTSQQGYISKSEPLGVFDKPFNPLKIALSAGATFVARTYAMDIPHMVEIFKKAIDHKGFSFVEVIQDCLIFNLEANKNHENIYKIEDCNNFELAEKFAQEWDYNSRQGKIPIGVIFQKEEPTLEEKWPQLKKLIDNKKSWKNK
jgi:2-oxoglutarate/2-oxoacid ferredoxin oxidoreductase subunit beta